MKSSNLHAILSELHRLLSVFTAAEFARASEYGGLSPRLKDALRALSDESERETLGLGYKTRDDVGARSTRRARGAVPRGQPDLSTEIVNVIRRQSGRFDNTSSILQFAKGAGLNLQSRPKESRERLARRVAEAILQTREPKRSEILASVAGNGDSQTQGWINVIKSRRP